MAFTLQRLFIRRNISFVLVFLFCNQLSAQQGDCVLLPPAVTIDFGAGNVRDMNIADPSKYRRLFDICPPDGFYSYAPHTSDCFRGDWLTFNNDHTGNPGGNMMLVNASETGGIFFYVIIPGLKPNTIYQFAAWLTNVCRINGGCRPLPPNISVRLLTTTGQMFAGFHTGLLTQNENVKWKKYYDFFLTPPDATSIIISMEDETLGGCGNDFAMDDITISECVEPVPVATPESTITTKPLIKKPVPDVHPPAKKVDTKPQPVKKEDSLSKNKTVSNLPTPPLPALQQQPVKTSIPQPILTRENPIVKKIETTAGEISIDLYDNGEIDGDTVSIYHNNKLIISRAGLSEKPIHFVIDLDANEPHHELIMVANNLGSIPPNTSLMIITVNNKRYEVYISSSEQKNAKVVIDLKE